MLLRRLENPGTAGLIFRRVYDDLKRNHIDKFFEEFPSLFRFYRATDHEVVLPAVAGKAPSRIVFAYAETENEVKRKFHGPEYMDMFIDQGEQLSELELKLMKTACRWPGESRYKCKFVVFFNPGGIGIDYFKRIFKDKEFREREKPDDYAFIQAYGWDNVEWVRSSLIEDGLTEVDFYSWSDDERFDYFITRSQYGQELDSLPPAMRIGHLMGSFDSFAGQYFDIWDPSKHVSNIPLLIEPWHPKWISIDWGMAHDAAVYWWAQDGQLSKTYREHVGSGVGPTELAATIISKCTKLEEKDAIDAIYLSPDAFDKRTSEDTIADQFWNVFKHYNLPRPRRADNNRKSGWMLMYDYLRYGKWVIDSSCKNLIRTIPTMARDDKDPEDCIKKLGDDSADSARYGLKSRFGSREVPKNVQLQRALVVVRNKTLDQTGDMSSVNTKLHLSHLKFDSDWKHKHRPFRFSRSWRGHR